MGGLNIREYEAETKKAAIAKATVDHGKDINILGWNEIKVGGIPFLKWGAKKAYRLRVMVPPQGGYQIQDKIRKDNREMKKHSTISGSELANSINRITDECRRSTAQARERINDLSAAEVNMVDTYAKEEKEEVYEKRLGTLEKSITETNSKIEKMLEVFLAQQQAKQATISVREEPKTYEIPQREEKSAGVQSEDNIISDEYFKSEKEEHSLPLFSRSDKIRKTYGESVLRDSAIVAPEKDKYIPSTPSEIKRDNVVEEHLLKLRRREFPEDMIDTLRDYLNHQSEARFFADESVVKKAVVRYFSDNLLLAKGIPVQGSKKRVIFLVGPTGVGKTTTIPKLATLFNTASRALRFITFDCYRIAAEEQIKRYASIMNIPCDLVQTHEVFREEVLKTKSNTFIFVDTTGRSPKRIDEISKMAKFLNSTGKVDVDVQLVLSATTKYYDAVEIMNSFRVLNYNGIIVSKVDETDYIGPVLSAAIQNETPITYFTFGQCVPRDIEEASSFKDNIINKIYGA